MLTDLLGEKPSNSALPQTEVVSVAVADNSGCPLGANEPISASFTKDHCAKPPEGEADPASSGEADDSSEDDESDPGGSSRKRLLRSVGVRFATPPP